VLLYSKTSALQQDKGVGGWGMDDEQSEHGLRALAATGGYLAKRGSWLRQWSSRHFMVVGEGCAVHLTKSGEGGITGRLALAYATLRAGRGRVFVLTGPAVVAKGEAPKQASMWRLRARTVEEAQQWAGALALIIAAARGAAAAEKGKADCTPPNSCYATTPSVRHLLAGGDADVLSDDGGAAVELGSAMQLSQPAAGNGTADGLPGRIVHAESELRQELDEVRARVARVTQLQVELGAMVREQERWRQAQEAPAAAAEAKAKVEV